jgi:hypothetical protein
MSTCPLAKSRAVKDWLKLNELLEKRFAAHCERNT